MNEELQKALTEILNGTLSAAGDAKQFLMAEIPEVVQQLLMWKLAEASVWMLFGVVLAVGGIITNWKIFKSKPDGKTPLRSWAWRVWSDGDIWMEAGALIACIFSGAVGFIGVLVTLINLATALQIWIAPKIYLIEYAATLVN